MHTTLYTHTFNINLIISCMSDHEMFCYNYTHNCEHACMGLKCNLAINIQHKILISC